MFLPADRMTGRPRGFAFVEYEDDLAAAEGIRKFDGFDLKGRTLRVSEATERRGGPGPGGFQGGNRPGGPPPGKRPKPKGSRRNARGRKRSL